MKSVPSQRGLARDWQQIRDRLTRACEALGESHRLSPEGARAVLEERARDLARVPSQAPSAAEVIAVVVFALGDERYALETSAVREVLRLGDITPLPETPAFLLGITNLRGHILPLFDLRQFFGVPAQEPTAEARVMVLGQERHEFGILADAVLEVARLRNDEVLAAPDSLPSSAREFARGVTEGALIVLDGAVLLKDSRLFIGLGPEPGYLDVQP
jgi:purine-binding chemotaxis protein CheW